LFGPAGFIEHVGHKLHAYRWNLVDRYACDLVFMVTEIDASRQTRVARFRLKNAFMPECAAGARIVDGVIHAEPGFEVATTILAHRTPCLAFAIKEAIHVNVWKNRLTELGLPVGPWLRELKRAVIENRPDDHLGRIDSSPASPQSRQMPLGPLRAVLTITPGQKIAYVTDAADTPANRRAIVVLIRDADLLFIEAAFAQADAALAADRAHLTTVAAGSIARTAQVRRIEPFHFSSRYAGEEARMLSEVMAAFTGA